ncbi:MAG: TonB-dependent receptor [Xanthomonadales bacterium]|nr:TonB-dependent receptor [Xanthomonadales bacterium]
MSIKSIWLALLTGVPFLIVGQPSLAQASDEEGVAIEEVIVTGTRIRSQNLESLNPVTTLDEQALEYIGNTSVQEIVREVGALVGSDGESEQSNGENQLNLRNLGTNRTLVLVNGRRFVGGFSGTTAVDTNVIPLALIERVDSLTGGASAIYGADAVTGVVNFVLKRDFEGLALEAQYGDAQDGDFRDQQYSITYGRNFSDGRGNITANLLYGERPLTPATARDESSIGIAEQINNYDNRTVNGVTPRFVLEAGTREAFFTEGGARFDPFNIFSTGFNGDGTPFENGLPVGSFAGTGQIGGDGIPNWILFGHGARPENERIILTATSHYDVSDRFQPYVDLHYSNVDARSLQQHSLTVGSQAARDNAFLPPAVLDAAEAVGYPGPIFFNRWDLDSGLIDQRIEKKTFRIVAGAEGQLNDRFSYDVSVNLGKVDRDITVRNNRMYDRYIAAMDSVVDPATGNIVCRSDLDPGSFNTLPSDFLQTSFDRSLGPVSFTAGPGSGCIPFNPFTTDSASNAAAIDWIWIPTTNSTENDQFVVQGYLSADTSGWFDLPGGPIDFVVGAEYREEESDIRFDAFSGTERVIAQFNGRDLAGEFDVLEAFGEFSAPVLGDTNAFVRGLTVNGAVRWSDYSTIGRTTTWKGGFTFETFGGLTLRATVSEAVRAPNVQELFQERSNISTSLGQFDPCNVDNLDLGTEFRRQNCATDLSALGVDPDSFMPQLGTFFPGITGGNPNLDEETADTETIGLLWQPEFVDGLTLSVDYFDIELQDAVLSPNQQAIFDACYDSASLDNVFCDLIGRDPTTGFANFVEIVAVNVAEIRTSGYELSGFYQLPFESFGDISLALNATRLEKLDVQRTPLPGLTDEVGLFNTFLGNSAPEWVANFDLTWRWGKWDANWGVNYSSETLRPPLINAQRDTAFEFIDDPFVDRFINHDLQVGYSFNDNARIYGGVRNLTDEYPDLVRGSLNGLSGRQGFAGRSFYMGYTQLMPDL